MIWSGINCKILILKGAVSGVKFVERYRKMTMTNDFKKISKNKDDDK